MEYIACPRFCTSRGFRCFSRSAASSSPSSIINIALFCVPERWRGSAATASSLIACPLWRFAAQKLADDVGRARSVCRHEHADHGHLVVIAAGGGQKLRRKAAAPTPLLADRLHRLTVAGVHPDRRAQRTRHARGVRGGFHRLLYYR